MFNVTAAAALALAVLAPSTSINAPTTAVPTETIVMEVQTVNGSGCAAGTATVTPNRDNTAFTVTYSDFYVQAGGHASAVESRKNCQINLRVRVPEGFTYAIAQVDHHGYAYLQPGATALQVAHYYFTGSSETTEASHKLAGPMRGAWQTTDRREVSSLVYARCGSESLLNINTELRVNAGSGDGINFVTMDSTRASARTLFHLSWQRCG